MELNKYIEHTCLKASATKEEIISLCKEAKKYHFASICINPTYIKEAVEQLKETNIDISVIVGYPLGTSTTSTKEFEAIEASNAGATEIEMVINIGELKNNNLDYIKKEIETIRDSVDGKVLKVIIETEYLTKEEIKIMTQICNETFVNYIKTSTGFSDEVKEEDIKIINTYKNELLEIEACGEIKTYEQVNELIELGVSRISTNNSVDIITLDEYK